MSIDREKKSRGWDLVRTDTSRLSETRAWTVLLTFALVGGLFLATTNCIAPSVGDPVWTSSDLGEKVSSIAVIPPYSGPVHPFSLTAIGLPQDGKVYLFKSGSSTPLWSKSETIPDWYHGQGDSISMSWDPVRVVVGKASGYTKVFDLDGNQKWSKLCSAQDVPVYATAITTWAELIFVGSGRKMCGYDISGNLVFTYQVHEDHAIRNIEVSQDGGVIALGTVDNKDGDDVSAKVYIIENTMWRAVGDSIRIHTSNTQMDVEDGSSRTYPVFVENRGQTTENISLSSTATAFGWSSSTDKENLFLAPGQFEQVNLTVTPPDGAMEQTSSLATLNATVVDNSSASNLSTTTTTVVQSQNNNSLPNATIDGLSNTTISYGSNVTFTGHGNDTDGSIDSYRWTSSIDGILNYSSNFTTSSLSEGVHTMYFDVQDDDDHWSLVDSAVVIVLPSAGYSLSKKVEYNVDDTGVTVRITWDGKRVAAGEFDYLFCPNDDDGSKVFYFTSGNDGLWGTMDDIIPLWIAIEPDDIGGIAIAEENGKFVFASPVGAESDGYTDAFYQTSDSVVDSWYTGDANALDYTMVLQQWADGDGYLAVGSADDDVIFINWLDDNANSEGNVKWTHDTGAPVTEVAMVGSLSRGQQPGPENMNFYLHLYSGNKDVGVTEGGYVSYWLYNYLNDY